MVKLVLISSPLFTEQKEAKVKSVYINLNIEAEEQWQDVSKIGNELISNKNVERIIVNEVFKAEDAKFIIQCILNTCNADFYCNILVNNFDTNNINRNEGTNANINGNIHESINTSENKDVKENKLEMNTKKVCYSFIPHRAQIIRDNLDTKFHNLEERRSVLLNALRVLDVLDIKHTLIALLAWINTQPESGGKNMPEWVQIGKNNRIHIDKLMVQFKDEEV